MKISFVQTAHEPQKEVQVRKYFPVMKDFQIRVFPLPSGKKGYRPFVGLCNVTNNQVELVETYKILKPEPKESIFNYMDRLRENLRELDDHAKIISLNID